MTLHPFLSPTPVAVAHRGGALEVPENSLAGFQRAVDMGYRYLETDCHLTADGYVVAAHDPTLDRATDREGAIGELTLAEVQAARILKPCGEPSHESIPLLEEVIQSFPDARINVDAKIDTVVDPLIALLRRLDVQDRMCVASFSADRLHRMRSALGPRACTSLNRSEITLLRAQSSIGRLPGNRFARDGLTNRVAQVPMRVAGPGGTTLDLVDEKFVAAAHAAGAHVHVWVVDDRDDMDRYFDRNVDGVMTDRPTLLADVLAERQSGLVGR